MCRTPVARVTTAATAGATYPKARRCPSAIPWPLVLSYSILVLYLIPKVDKGVVLGVAQTLGTGYFPAASARGAGFFNPVAGGLRLTTTMQAY